MAEPDAHERRAAVLAAFHLVQDVQTPRAAAARVEIDARLSDAQARGWSDVVTTLLYARAVDADANLPAEAPAAVAELVKRAELESDSAMLAAGLGMRAELAARSGNVTTFAPDASQAMLLLDQESEPIALTSAMICVALAYEALNLWELGDELYTRAEALLPLSDDPLLTPVIGINRAQTRFWWTAALVEAGRTSEAADIAVDDASPQPPSLPDSWEQELQVNWLAEQVISGQAGTGVQAQLESYEQQLVSPGWIARAQIHLALTHLALTDGRLDEARARASQAVALTSVHGTPYQRSFALWTLSLVEQAADPDQGTAARTYAACLVAQRWEERMGRLTTAREQVHAARLRGEHDHLVRRTLEDPLTGLGNRRALEERLDYLRATLGDVEVVSMLVVDIDRFKRVNDIYGHEVGDRVLRRVGAAIAAVLRPEDLAFRFGGDEFGAIMAGAAAEVVQERADQICRRVCADSWDELAPELQVTVSVGVATTTGIGAIDGLYARADAALYAAKSAGPGLLRIAL